MLVKKSWALLLLGSATLVSLVGCSSTAGTGDGGGEASGTPASVVEEAQAEVETALRAPFRDLPSEGPEGQAGKNVWMISLSQQTEGALSMFLAAQEAAETLGWDVTLVDGANDMAKISSAIDSAAAAGADGILLGGGVDCQPVKGALERAKEAGVQTYLMAGLDCDDPYAGNAEPVVTASLNIFGDANYGQHIEGLSKLMADYVIAKSDGAAKVIWMSETDTALVKHLDTGWKDGIAKCTGCDVSTYSFTYADLLGGKFTAQVSAALAQTPEAEWLALPYDAALQLGAQEAIRAAGRTDIKVLATGGTRQGLDAIRAGDQVMTVADSGAWTGWAAIDGMNRMFAGEEQVDAGQAGQIVDVDNNLPKDGPYDPGVPFIDNYKRIWGVG